MRRVGRDFPNVSIVYSGLSLKLSYRVKPSKLKVTYYGGTR